MLMLTHTYLLQTYLGKESTESGNLDIYVYNIVPDLLTIHPDINSNQTHGINRTLKIPSEYPGAAYVMFHLLLDDLAHYGHICRDCQEVFDPNSQGFSYLKGRSLIKPLLQLYKEVHKDISYNEAAYRSHLIIEMLYDLVIMTHINAAKTIELLAEAINYTVENKMYEFVRTIEWLYNVKEIQIQEVMEGASFYITKERMERIMTIEERIKLYANKFGTKINYNGVKDLFMQASVLLAKDSDFFLRQSAQTIKEYGWLPPPR